MMTQQNIDNSRTDKFAGRSENTEHRSNAKTSASKLIGSRIPPHSEEAEEAVLCSILLSKLAIPKVVEHLQSDAFYNPRNKMIYEAAIQLWNDNSGVDATTLFDTLRKNGTDKLAGGAGYIAELTKVVPSAVNVEQYSRIVLEHYLKRLLLEQGEKIVARCYDQTSNVVDEIDAAEQAIFQISEKRFLRSFSSLHDLTLKVMGTIESLRNRDTGGITGVSTGYPELDRYLGGFQKSDLIIIAARPSMGKTALSLSIARNVAINKKIPVAYFSVEMSSSQLVQRLLSAEAKVDQQKIRNGKLNQIDMDQIAKACGALSNAPLYIDDSPAMNLMELKAKCRRLKVENGIELVMIDYLQLLHAQADSREREISVISRSLKQMAKELDLPVVAMAQLNRGVEARPDKRPMLQDLRESGSIEQDADVVMFINRPEVYGIKTYEDDGVPTEGTAEIIIGKQRNGATGTIRLAFVKEYARFENLAMFNEEPPEEYAAAPASVVAPVPPMDNMRDEVPF